MSAEIQIRDSQAGVAMAWHGLTKVVPIVTKEIAFPFEIERKPIFINTGKLVKVPDFSVFVSSDDKQICGKPMADTYHALTNSRFWEIVENSLGGTGATVESAGTLKDRSRRFITVHLNENKDFAIGERVFQNRVSFLDSIDGSTYFYGVNSSTCVVCANTFRMVKNDASAGFKFKLRHTQGMPVAIEGMEKTINELIGVAAEFKIALEAAASEKVNEVQAKNLFAGWIGIGAKELSTRAENTVTRLTELYRGGAGNRGETLLDTFQAVTDFYSHESSGGEDKPNFRWKQFNSSENGDGRASKEHFYSSIFSFEKDSFLGVDRENITAMQSRGAALLAV